MCVNEGPVKNVIFKDPDDKPVSTMLVKDAPKPVAIRRENECHPAKDPVTVPDSNKRRPNSPLEPPPPAKKKSVLSANPPGKTKSRPRSQKKPLSDAVNELQAKQQSKANRENESKLIPKPEQQVSKRRRSATSPSRSTVDCKHAKNTPGKSRRTASKQPAKGQGRDGTKERNSYKTDRSNKNIIIPAKEPVLSAAQKKILSPFKVTIVFYKVLLEHVTICEDSSRVQR